MIRRPREKAEGDEETDVFTTLLELLIQLARVRRRPLPNAAHEEPFGRRVQDRHSRIDVAVAEPAEYQRRRGFH